MTLCLPLVLTPELIGMRQSLSCAQFGAASLRDRPAESRGRTSGDGGGQCAEPSDDESSVSGLCWSGGSLDGHGVERGARGGALQMSFPGGQEGGGCACTPAPSSAACGRAAAECGR